MNNNEIKILIENSKNGDSDSLESLILNIKDDIYALSLRIIFNKQTAEDATQEILIKIITHLSSFENKSNFRTWYYRITYNHLIDMIRKNQSFNLTFENFRNDLLTNMSELTKEEESRPDIQYELEEVRLGCTLALLQCLNQEERSTYILGEILMLETEEGADIMSITPSSFRKKLERSRKKILDFTKANCGIQNSNNPCHCSKRYKAAKSLGRIPNNLNDINENRKMLKETVQIMKSLKEDQRVVAQYRSFNPLYPKDFSKKVKEMVKNYLV